MVEEEKNFNELLFLSEFFICVECQGRGELVAHGQWRFVFGDSTVFKGWRRPNAEFFWADVCGGNRLLKEWRVLLHEE